MTVADRQYLLQRLDERRDQLEQLLPKIDQTKEIYPQWTLKELLAHMTGWDDATIDSLRAHISGLPPSVEAVRSLNAYNAQTVSTRKDLDYEQVLREWRLTRQVLRTIIEQMPDDKLLEPVIVPWGEKTTVTYLVEMFRDHEQEHAHDIQRWLENPNQPIK